VDPQVAAAVVVGVVLGVGQVAVGVVAAVLVVVVEPDSTKVYLSLSEAFHPLTMLLLLLCSSWLRSC
jgi:hypothetical protein